MYIYTHERADKILNILTTASTRRGEIVDGSHKTHKTNDCHDCEKHCCDLYATACQTLRKSTNDLWQYSGPDQDRPGDNSHPPGSQVRDIDVSQPPQAAGVHGSHIPAVCNLGFKLFGLAAGNEGWFLEKVRPDGSPGILFSDTTMQT